jgi:tight adherence protein B
VTGALVLSAAAAYGVFLLFTAVGLGWQGLGVGPRDGGVVGGGGTAVRDGASLGAGGVGGGSVGRVGCVGRVAGGGSGSARRLAARPRLVVPGREVAAVSAVLGLGGVVLGLAVFGGALPALVAGAFAATFPPASHRARRQRRREDARDAWPRLIEEVRLQTGALGRSIPQALFEVGRRAPLDMRPAFALGEREWLLSTDLDRTVAVLKRELADAAADAVLETLLVAHQVGGSDVDRRLAALVEDRVQDVQGRKDARAKQAGVRFARRFVLIVPLGMALAGLSIGTGRAAYQTPTGQAAVASGLVVVAGCWVWAGRLLRLPEEERVFDAAA